MQYMLLIYTDPATEPGPDDAGFADYMKGYEKATRTFQDDGVFVYGDALEAPATATVIKARKGRVEAIDGPFAESKEQLGGFYILDCPDLDAAIRYAAMIPAAGLGAIEIRPVMPVEF